MQYSPGVAFWLEQFRYYRLFRRSPVELGWCDPDELDPRYYEVISLIEAEHTRLKAAALNPTTR